MAFDRGAALRRLADEPFDVLVVGGGITGTGVALDAASRGLRTALVERRDLAAGTSSKSSKLVHGGLRYLQQREFRLVYEALAERQRLRTLAPHLVHLLPFLLPIFGKGGIVHPKLVKAMRSAMWMYDFTGGARIGKLHERISAEESLAHMPSLDPDKVVGGFIYYDARTDDARLTLAVARTAADHGAAVATWCPVVGLEKDGNGAVVGARVRPVERGVEGGTITVRASVVVNATGVWGDELAAMDQGPSAPSIRPAKGVHVTVPWDRLRNDIAAVLPVPKDRRSIFVVPDGDRTYIGTTDTDYDGPLDDPVCTAEDVAYVLRAVNASVKEPLTPDDVLGTWAGLRPLVRGAKSNRTADLSRRHVVARSSTGIIGVTGGKLTTYRRMAADAVDAVVEVLGRGGRSRTRRIRLHGAEGSEGLSSPEAAARLGLEPPVLAHLAGRYGGDARTVAAMVAADPGLGVPLVPTLPHLRAEALYAARYEMAQTLDDVLSRRIPARRMAAEASAEAAEDAARLVAPELGWSEQEIARQVASYRASIAAELAAAGLEPAPVVV
jgi:glycerol-3-phosphate dehydrogenase